MGGHALGAPDQNTEFANALRHVSAPLEGLIFDVAYTDALGDQPERLKLGIGTQGGSTAWRVVTVEHRA